ncbi:putative peptide maturation dehydrogenase [Stenotrophomonas sp. S48]|uniref:putative peptide maturation dehydrogenase n=1 Tax=unclassified Stenotrophomonas TaxID=196198 RepID=UPI001901F809|nr:MULTISPECIES: putative peptide maturation dehydrogenase [unclassified Stenotrophomonas]MBK0025125.1 putative peptide maturation dehydrogenase [Stenotrophomonas sp. S48]MBK0046834.1 putative peptide maturation dehydrogenase [Stenotrophomonas sp. S49]
MKVRRCSIIMFESKAELSLDMPLLMSGGAGLATTMQWYALPGHLDAPIDISSEELILLGQFEPDRWVDVTEVHVDQSQMMRLVELGILISDDPAWESHKGRDEDVRSTNWWPLAALAHRMGRWAGVDSAKEMHESKLVTADDLLMKFGPPPPSVAAPDASAIRLPDTISDARDELLRLRVTCRNFDSSRALPLPMLSQVMKRTMKAHAVVRPGPGIEFLKKNIPSGGGLHPLETYVISLDVEGLAAGVYHYHSVEHSLREIASHREGLRESVLGYLSGQYWFVDASVHIVQVARFSRSFWKYRNHSKAYRAVLLDAGHLSQQWMLSATELGLAAYVTAGINEIDLEELLGLDGIESSPIMMCGLGWRAQSQATSEFDPLARIWSE